MIFAILEEPGATSSMAGFGTKMPEPLVIHRNLAIAFPVLVMTTFSEINMSVQSSGNPNFMVFFDTSRDTGSAIAWTLNLKGIVSLMK